jgi:hypothetical protein
MKQFIVFLSLLSVLGCNAPAATTPLAASTTSPVTVIPVPVVTPVVVVTPTPTPTVTPTPTPTVTVDTFESSQAFPICSAFFNWDSETTTIAVEYDGYTYNFAGIGVTVTYSTGPYDGQTQEVSTPVTIGWGGNGEVYLCSVEVSGGAITKINQDVNL